VTLAIVGAELVSPAGRSAVQHAMFLRAGAPPPPVSPFLLPDDRRLRVFYCPWLGARLPVSARLTALAEAAIEGALAPIGTVRDPHVVLSTGAPRPGLTNADVAVLEDAVRVRLRPASVERVAGDAGAFGVLERLAAASGRHETIVLLAVDSFIAFETLEDLALHPHSPWQRRPPHPSEAAAALVLMDSAVARRVVAQAIGFVDGAGTARDPATDDNDEIAQGTALTQVIAGLPAREQVALVFGQSDVDSLRMQDWVIASARNHARLRPDCEMVCLEADIGRVGGASAVASMVHGLTVLRHGVSPREVTPGAPFFAWAASPDGTRGAASLRCA
jgi:hypothetical protein